MIPPGQTLLSRRETQRIPSQDGVCLLSGLGSFRPGGTGIQGDQTQHTDQGSGWHVRWYMRRGKPAWGTLRAR